MFEKILAALTAVFGVGWAGQFLYTRYDKRKKAAEAKDAEINVDEKEDKLRDKKLSDAYDTIVALQRIVDEERNKWVEIARELSKVKRELIREKEARELAEENKCTKPGCLNRQPPRTGIDG